MHFAEGPKPPNPPCRPNIEINMTSDTEQHARYLHRSCKSRVQPGPIRPSPCQASRHGFAGTSLEVSLSHGPVPGVSHSGASQWGNLQYESPSPTIRKSVRPSPGKHSAPPNCPTRQTSVTPNARGTQSRRASAKSARTRCKLADEASAQYKGHASASH